MMGNLVGKLLLVDFGIQYAGFIVASYFQTEKFYDAFGSATYVAVTLLAAYSRNILPLPQLIQSGMVVLWASRLGLYLFHRAISHNGDRRFDNIKTNPLRFFIAWTLQGVWVAITVSPTIAMILLPTQARLDQSIWTPSIVGWSLFGAGFLLETIADIQKSRFRSDPANQKNFISHGLWAISRHPNYLGEIILWSGLAISAAANTRVQMPHLLLFSVSPAFVTFLLTSVSGIPLLEKSAEKRWGGMYQYQMYKRRTACLVPFIW